MFNQKDINAQFSVLNETMLNVLSEIVCLVSILLLIVNDKYIVWRKHKIKI